MCYAYGISGQYLSVQLIDGPIFAMWVHGVLSEKEFAEISGRSLASWNSIICTFAANGDAEAALKISQYDIFTGALQMKSALQELFLLVDPLV
ncbi:hypothetical protein Nepgr_014025 [Nepenthes gracilis]|uniref:Uncharacterized protein n=1 Tax=Nepenthes gracilis TaxID=150966 RepID=A0AAD3SK46_NEPGR|nr:hypothetical protein Nepgr_014025 [Nepenthes gracilis]